MIDFTTGMDDPSLRLYQFHFNTEGKTVLAQRVLQASDIPHVNLLCQAFFRYCRDFFECNRRHHRRRRGRCALSRTDRAAVSGARASGVGVISLTRCVVDNAELD